MISNYNELPIGKFIEFTRIPYEGRDEVDYMLDIVSLLSGKSVDELAVMPIIEFSALCGKAQFLQQMPKVRGANIDKVKIGKWNLRVTKGARKMQTNQYVDFQTFIKQGNESLIQQLSCVLVPEGLRYGEGYDIAELQQDLAALPTQTALEIQAFFLRRSYRSIISILIYLGLISHLMGRKKGRKMRMEVKKAMESLNRISKLNGDGSMR